MKKSLALILLVVMMLQVFPKRTVSGEESGTPKHIPRVVSVVFDNSGSMYNDTDRWAYASYAMQAFCAMMGEEDVLHVTYINNPKVSTKVNLSAGGKQSSVDEFERITFGGGTSNKMDKAAKILVDEYKKYGKTAKYYFVVMADGELDSSYGEFSQKLPEASEYVKNNLDGADYSAIFFSMMNEKMVIDGVECCGASTGDKLVNELRKVSAEIMGRTDITEFCTVSGGNVSFNLDYPALSIAIFPQKTTTSLDGVRVSARREGSSSSYNVDTYYIDCPDTIIKDYSTAVYKEKKASPPPSGLVSLITNRNSSLPKGKYTLSLSGGNLSKGDFVVLVEPAVKIGCTYFIEDDETPMTFNEMMSNAREGNVITVKCGLYELNEDGTLGEAVPESILSPSFAVYVNDVSIGEKVVNDKNAYMFKLLKEYEKKDVKIEAKLNGYAPFVSRETFGTILTEPVIVPGLIQELTLTVDLWNKWKQGQEAIVFPFENVNNHMLSYLSVSYEGTNGFVSGKCNSLSGIGISGNNMNYIPTSKEGMDFSSLPDKFSIVLSDSTSGKKVCTVKVNVVKPQYKFEVENSLGDYNISLEELKTNSNGISFILMKDILGNGNYVKVEADEKISLEVGSFPGIVKCEKDVATFTPFLNSEEGGNTNFNDFVGKNHKIYATAVIDGVNVKSEEITLSVDKPQYKFEVKNPFENQKLTLSILKTNLNGISFSLMVDYFGSGNYVKVEKNIDIVIESGKLQGEIKNVNGEVFFVPFYDINLGTDISPADILGKDHIIIAKATIDGETIESEKVILSVSTATYKIVLDSVITEAFTLDTIKNNSQKITFSIQADYDENGVFGQIASWDIGVYELLSINSGELPGRFVTEYDESKKIIGKSFVPIYDENNNGGIVFTKVAGRVHSIRASIEQYNIFEETTVEVKAPIYDISLRKDRIRVLDVSIRKNTEGVEFIVSRDGRILNYEELDALSPFNIELSRNKDSIKMECSVKTDESGNSYIFCRPDYSGKFYIPISVFNWICMLSIEDGETIATYTLGKNSASATIDIETSELAVIVCIICLAVLLLVLWMLFCYLTRKRIVKGLFFIANYKRIEGHPSKYKFEGAYQVKSYGLRHFFHGSLLIPFSEPKIFVGGKICTTTAFRKGTPEIRFERGSNGEYVPHISGVFVAEEDWNHLVTNQINVLDEVGFNQFTESSAKFVFGTQNYIVKDNGGNVLSLITFASNDTIKAIRRMLEMIEQNNK